MNQKLEQFSEILLKWNKTHNLSGAKTKEEISFQIKDSIYPLEFLGEFDTLLDIGSGGGFPAIPLAILKNDANFTLVEPIKKKVAFLNYIKLKLSLTNIEIINKRIEDVVQKSYDIITSKAVASTTKIFELALPFMDSNSRLLLYKSKNEEVDIEAEMIKNNFSKYIILRKQKWEN